MGVGEVKETRYVDKDFVIENMTKEMQRIWNKDSKTDLEMAYSQAIFVARDFIMRAPVITVRETRYGKCIMNGESDDRAACVGGL